MSSSTMPEINKTGIIERVAWDRTCAHTSNPLLSGIITSAIIMSGWPAVRPASASSPFAANSTSKPAASNRRSATLRTLRLSSQINTFGMILQSSYLRICGLEALTHLENQGALLDGLRDICIRAQVRRDLAMFVRRARGHNHNGSCTGVREF